jgi:uncharacterized protein
MDIVLIPSTQCNLRCPYCYELSLLRDKGRMSLAALEIVFQRLADYFRQESVESARFIWHGGEPLLLPPEYYWQAFEVQKQCFRETTTKIANLTQTNLTILDDARTELLRNGFAGAGVSLDLFGSLRVDAGGMCREDKALANLERLLRMGVRLGGITVLTRANRFAVRRIYDFYRERDMGFRLLPLHAGDFAAGQWFEIGPTDTLNAFRVLADLWLTDPEAPFIQPVVDVIRAVYQMHTTGEPVELYDKGRWEALLAIDREGFVYSYNDIHNRTRSYGNLLDTPLATLLAGPVRTKVVAQTSAQVQATCHRCPHFGRTCNSYPVAEGAQDSWERNPDGSIRCTAFSGLIEHIEMRLAEAGLLPPCKVTRLQSQ